MSSANVDIIRKAFEVLRDEGVDAVLEFVDPEFVGVSPPELSVEPQAYHGRAGFKRWFTSFYEAVDELRLEPEECIDAGDQVVLPMRIVVRGHGSGIEVAQRVTQVWTLRDGLAVRVDAYADKETALRAIAAKDESPAG